MTTVSGAPIEGTADLEVKFFRSEFGTDEIGTTSPTAKVDVNGQILSRVYDAGSSTVIDWNNGNAQYTSASCGSFTFSNMLDGGNYTLAVNGTTSGTCTFTHSELTFNFVPSNGATTNGKKTLYTFLRMGANVYVTWIKGF